MWQQSVKYNHRSKVRHEAKRQETVQVRVQVEDQVFPVDCSLAKSHPEQRSSHITSVQRGEDAARAQRFTVY